MLKSNIKNILLLICAFVAVGTSPVYALDNLKIYIPEVQKVGHGRMTYMLWDVYDATLYAPQGVWNNDKPFALQISYLRTIEGKKIADRSVAEMRVQGSFDEVKLATWHSQMRNIFPDVSEGVSLTGVYMGAGTTVFYKDNVQIGRIHDPEFSKAFFGIWLDEKTSAPSLRQKLLGLV